jgi:hypothetical protein
VIAIISKIGAIKRLRNTLKIYIRIHYVVEASAQTLFLFILSPHQPKTRSFFPFFCKTKAIAAATSKLQSVLYCTSSTFYCEEAFFARASSSALALNFAKLALARSCAESAEPAALTAPAPAPEAVEACTELLVTELDTFEEDDEDDDVAVVARECR